MSDLVVYLQLFASLHNVASNITENSVRQPAVAFHSNRSSHSRVSSQLTIMYASATVFGRILPGILADRVGPLTVLVVYTFIGGGIIFAMLGAHNGAGVVIFAVIYGPCNAACKQSPFCLCESGDLIVAL